MILSPRIQDYFQIRARDLSLEPPALETNLYLAGLLDSFELMSLVALIEQEHNLSSRIMKLTLSDSKRSRPLKNSLRLNPKCVIRTFIIGTGSALPNRIVSISELSAILEVESDFIFEKAGIRERRWADPDTKTSDLASDALEMALEDADIKAADIDYLVLGTMTPDRMIPGTAPAVQRQVA